MKKLLIDTNIVIALFAGDPGVTDRIGRAEYVFIPAVVIGELLYGANKSGRPEENKERIERFASDNLILNCNTETARWYGKIKNALQKKGRPIPENDILLPASKASACSRLKSKSTPKASARGLSSRMRAS